MNTPDRDPTIPGFCARHKLSRAMFYVLVDRGEAPRTYVVGKLRRISPEAEAAWVREREAAAAERAVEAA